MKFLLANSFFTEFWDSFLPRLQSTEIIIAIVLAVVGLSVAVLARRFARVIRDRNDIENSDGVLITIKCISLAFVLSSALMFIFTA